MSILESPQLDWSSGQLRSLTHNDIYHSSDGAVAQCQAVFLQGNGLPERFTTDRPFVILETGFGLGINFLVSWLAWRQWREGKNISHENGALRLPPRLHFISVEKYPLGREELKQALAHFPDLALLAQQLIEQWPPRVSGPHHLEFEQGALVLTLHLGEVTEVMSSLRIAADAIYLDGFAPDRNPEMWSPYLMRQLARQCHPGTTLASWCVAGDVRRALMHEGFSVKKETGFGAKRHRLEAHFDAIPLAAFERMNTPARNPALYRRAHPLPKEAVIVGAGLAGCLMAEALCRRGWRVKLIDRHGEPAQEASGNRAGIFRPFLSVDDNEHSQLCRAGFLYTSGLLQRLQQNDTIEMKVTGVLHLADSVEEEERFFQSVQQQNLPADYVQTLNREKAGIMTGIAAEHGGIFFPQAGWVRPQSLCRAALSAAGGNLETLWNTEVTQIKPKGSFWQLTLPNGQTLSTPTLILALGADANRLYPESNSLVRIRGQVTAVTPDPFPANTPVLCGEGYIISGLPEGLCVGASFDVEDLDSEARASSQQENLERLLRFHPEFKPEAGTLSDRVGFRTMTKNRMPIAKEMLPGLHALMGLGSHGLIWAGYLAEGLAERLDG